MLDRTLWKETTHRPIKMLSELTPEQIAAATGDPLFRTYNAVLMNLDRDLQDGDLTAATARRPVKRQLGFAHVAVTPLSSVASACGSVITWAQFSGPICRICSVKSVTTSA